MQIPEFNRGNEAFLWQTASPHLDGGGEGHADLLFVIGEEAGRVDLDLPGPGSRLGIEVSHLTCQSNKRAREHLLAQDTCDM